VNLSEFQGIICTYADPGATRRSLDVLEMCTLDRLMI
jgi:hypothetical protein